MTKKAEIWCGMVPHLKRHRFLVGAAGIRYGSVVYIGFGNGIVTGHVGRASTTRYPVEIEFGADQWDLSREGKTILTSDFGHTETSRGILKEALIGREIEGILLSDLYSVVVFDCRTQFRSKLAEDPASGFLYSFYDEKTGSWETLDGISILT